MWVTDFFKVSRPSTLDSTFFFKPTLSEDPLLNKQVFAQITGSDAKIIDELIFMLSFVGTMRYKALRLCGSPDVAQMMDSPHYHTCLALIRTIALFMWFCEAH